jgi:hypothetical protein
LRTWPELVAAKVVVSVPTTTTTPLCLSDNNSN